LTGQVITGWEKLKTDTRKKKQKKGVRKRKKIRKPIEGVS